MKDIKIANHIIGAGCPAFVLAEAGVNHNGNLDLARKLIETAAAAGADAIKFQTFKAANLATRDAPKANYQLDTTDAQESQYDMLCRLELSAEAHAELMAHCRKNRLLFLSTPFDEESANLLETLGVPAFKISSGEITNLPFLEHVARKGKPILLSTGMSELGEVEMAVKKIREQGNEQIVLLQCVSNYPAEPADVNLRAMAAMASACNTLTGYSDHTLGSEAPLAAVALGACVIEKHFTLDRNLPGPDHRASLEPDELKALVRSIRIVEAALGNGIKRPAASEENTRQVARKSLVAARDLPAGTRLEKEMIAIKRPGTGLAPALRDDLVGRTLNTDVAAGRLFTLEMFT